MKISRTTVRKYIKDYESKCEEIEELARNNNITNKYTLNLVSEMLSTPKYDTSSETIIKLTDEIIDKINELM